MSDTNGTPMSVDEMTARLHRLEMRYGQHALRLVAQLALFHLDELEAGGAARVLDKAAETFTNDGDR